MTINTPIPQDLKEEAVKCAGILEKFMKPEQGNLDTVIPSRVIEQAKGLAIMTVIKAGFVWSGRAGSGLVIARLPDGTWSAPSAIGTAGMGFGGQIGGQLTDFVIVLNTDDAVRAFSMGGNVTLGGNLSVAAGPMGRSVEAGSTLGKLAPVYSYSKSKGLFAGVSIEGSVILERKDANTQFYGRKVSAKEILSGKIANPAECEVLYRAIQKQIQLGRELEERRGDPRPTTTKPGQKQQKQFVGSPTSPTSPTAVAYPSPPPQYSTMPNSGPTSGSKRPPPLPPNRPTKPILARAIYTYVAERESDLSFQEGDLITVTRKTDSQNDWWSGRLHDKSGDVRFS